MDTYKTDEPTTTTSTEDFEILDDSTYIWIPFVVLLGILALSALVYLMARNRKPISHAYCKRRLATRYFIDNSYDYEADRNLLNEEDYVEERAATQSLLHGKLRINNHYETYQTTSVIRTDANSNNNVPT